MTLAPEPKTGDPIPRTGRDKPPPLKRGRKPNAVIAASLHANRKPAPSPPPALEPEPPLEPAQRAASPGPKAPPVGAGPTRRGGKAANPKDIDTLATQIVGYHMMLAGFMNAPIMQVNLIEARILAEAVLQVQDEFGLEIGGKAGAVLGLIAAASMVYVPRMFAYSMQMKAMAGQGTAPGQPPGPGGRNGPAPTAPFDLSDVNVMADVPVDDGLRGSPGPVSGAPGAAHGGAPYVTGNGEAPPVTRTNGGAGPAMMGDVPVG